MTAIEEALRLNNSLILDIQEQLLTANLTNLTNATAISNVTGK